MGNHSINLKKKETMQNSKKESRAECVFLLKPSRCVFLVNETKVSWALDKETAIQVLSV